MKKLFFTLAFVFVASFGFANSSKNINKPVYDSTVSANEVSESVIFIEYSISNEYFVKCYRRTCIIVNGEKLCGAWREVPCGVTIVIEEKKE